MHVLTKNKNVGKKIIICSISELAKIAIVPQNFCNFVCQVISTTMHSSQFHSKTPGYHRDNLGPPTLLKKEG